MKNRLQKQFELLTRSPHPNPSLAREVEDVAASCLSKTESLRTSGKVVPFIETSADDAMLGMSEPINDRPD
jgi:hypothetical protein